MLFKNTHLKLCSWDQIYIFPFHFSSTWKYIKLNINFHRNEIISIPFLWNSKHSTKQKIVVISNPHSEWKYIILKLYYIKKYIKLNINFHWNEIDMPWNTRRSRHHLVVIPSRTKGEKIEWIRNKGQCVHKFIPYELIWYKKNDPLEIALPLLCLQLRSGWENQLEELLMSLCKHFWCSNSRSCNQIVLALFIYWRGYSLSVIVFLGNAFGGM